MEREREREREREPFCGDINPMWQRKRVLRFSDFREKWGLGLRSFQLEGEWSTGTFIYE